MKKKYIKLNIDDNYLTLGNFCRILKQMAINKSNALQINIFASLFLNDTINETTVNNYCLGIRSIASEYKQFYLNRLSKYHKNKLSMTDIVINILSILDGKVYYDLTDSEIYNRVNSSKSMLEFTNKLYNISKNDSEVSLELTNKLLEYLNNNLIYEAFLEMLFFIILEHKQPIYEEDLKQNLLENILSNTNISTSNLEAYLNLKFDSGTNDYYSLKKLADNKNPYACYDLGEMEYLGYIKGHPRYNISFKYLSIATYAKHPKAAYLLGRMYLNGNIASITNDTLKEAYNCFKLAADLGNSSALNSLGLFYLNGIYPIDKDLKKAEEYFLKASLKNYAYAFNNLGKIEENKKNYIKAYNNYFKSANLGDSWAANKVGEYLRNGLGPNKDPIEAYNYYNKGLEAPKRYLCYYNYYNLAKYYYLNGYLNIAKNKKKAYMYLKIASNNNILEASVLLLKLYIKDYLNTHNKKILDNIYKLKQILENHPKYNNNLRLEIENDLKKISTFKDIDILDIINS